MRGINLDKIDKDLRADDTKAKIKILKQVNFSTYAEEFMINNHDGFEKLMRLYDILNPDWVKTHNREERKKPKNVQTFLNPSITIQDIIDEAAGDEITELALTTLVSNRLAHYISNIIKRRVEIYKNKNDMFLSKNDFTEVSESVRRYFDPNNKERRLTLKWIEANLLSYNIDISQFNRSEMETLVSAQNTAFSLKDHALYKMITLLKERDDINYGHILDPNGKDAFVVDLPYYGQFSVHLKKPKLSKQCMENDTKEYKESSKQQVRKEDDESNEVRKKIFDLLEDQSYEQDLYETTNIMLTSEVSQEAESFSKSLMKLKNDDEKIARIKEVEENDPRYAHYLMVKNGYDPRGDKNDESGVR